MTDTMSMTAIHQHLDECPTDWIARLALADLYEEAGDELRATYQRWAVKWKRTPLVWDARDRDHKDHPWHWWWEDVRLYPPARIDNYLLAQIPEYSRGHATRSESEDQLAAILARHGWPDLRMA